MCPLSMQELVAKDGEFSRLMQESGIRSDEEVDDEPGTPDTRCPGSPWSDIGKVNMWGKTWVFGVNFAECFALHHANSCLTHWLCVNGLSCETLVVCFIDTPFNPSNL